jgi:hypothetical protein
VKAPDCYGQIDLYGDDVSYDGKTGEGHGPLPYQPDNIATPYHLIAAWNGGEKPCAPATPDSPSPSQSAPATPTTPAASEPPADKTTEPASPKPSSTPSTTPDVPPLTSTPPATPSPSPSESTPPLAETGASGPLGPIAGGAALVIVAGAGAVVMSRRARRS